MLLHPHTAAPVPARIYLVGFMGAGKSTVGRILSGNLGWQFLDLDLLIEKEYRAPVSALFQSHGEDAFREMELQALRVIHGLHRAVISLGGGAIETEGVRTLMHATEGSLVVFLEAPLDLLIGRCLAQDGGAGRPLLQQRDQLDARYDLRLSHYRNAHLTVATQSLTPERVAASIMDHLAALKDGNLHE